MAKTAHCCCGALKAEVEGDPTAVVACHCEQCQRRSGAAFGIGAYYPKAQVRTEGTSKVFTRDGQEGRKLRMHFCPNCGSTVFWELDLRPEHFGIAVGSFYDPGFPAPTVSVWEQSKHSWPSFGANVLRYPQGRNVK